jgi:hypothetical protein
MVTPKSEIDSGIEEFISKIDSKKIKKFIEDFLSKHFKLADEVVEHHINILEKNGFQETDIDYIQLQRFIKSAVAHLGMLDLRIKDTLFMKLYNDINALTEFLNKLITQNKAIGHIYKTKFLPQMPAYKELEKQLSMDESRIKQMKAIAQATQNQINALEAKSDKEKYKDEIKSLRAKNVDAIHIAGVLSDRIEEIRKLTSKVERESKELFTSMFKEYLEYYVESLKMIINIKSFYFDKLLWHKAKNSNSIKKFFKDANIKGDYNIKTYMEHYLRNIDSSRVRNSEWHKYIMECLKKLK